MSVDKEEIAKAETIAASTPGQSAPAQPSTVDIDGTRLEAAGLEGRYAPLKVLGEGGMGVVELRRDERIGRDVALKLIKRDQATAEDAPMRFLREARVQAQLEHPAVVPVYDLGTAPDGTVYFTMKRVRGRTLEEVIGDLRRDEPGVRQRYTRRRLLSVLASVCLAVDYAHESGVVHRDLKPANIMLGDFGEVWVLDWGLAKLLTSDAAHSVRRTPVVVPDQLRSLHDGIYGTPGYMAPEQIVGDAVDRRSDNYSLGAILFELLTLEPLHRGKSSFELMTSTQLGDGIAPSHRRPDLDIPPELDRVCIHATNHEASRRPARARDIADAIERYLDGDRDKELRREASQKEAERASELLAVVTPGAEEQARTDAIRAVGRALALDPKNGPALATLLRLLTEPPSEIPAPAQRAIVVQTQAHDRAAARGAIVIYLGTALLYGALVAWLGVLHVASLAITVGGFVAAALLSWADSRDTGTRYEFAVLIASVIGIVGSSRMLGPLILVPTFALGNTLGFALTPRKRRRMIFIAVGCMSFLGPAAAEWLGWLEPSYRFHDGVMSVVPQMHALPPTATFAALVAIALVSTIGASMFVGDMRDALSAADRKLQLQTWQLSQLVPSSGSAGSEREPSKRPPPL